LGDEYKDVKEELSEGEELDICKSESENGETGYEQENLGLFDLDDNEADEFGAVKPWIGNLKAMTPDDFDYEQDL